MYAIDYLAYFLNLILMKKRFWQKKKSVAKLH